ncbi:MAG: hypothetical protein LBD37_02065 [Treponema sp.]|nr:hypothetical protein [Treponema sp.]
MFFPLTFYKVIFVMKQYDNPALPAAIFSIQSGRTLPNTHNCKASLDFVKRVMSESGALVLRSKRIGPIIAMIISEIGLANPAALKAAETGARQRRA